MEGIDQHDAAILEIPSIAGGQHDHSPKSGGSRWDSRNGNSSSMPPYGSALARMLCARHYPLNGSTCSALRRMRRASSSIDFACRADSRSNSAFRASSRLRIAMLAIGKLFRSDCDDCIVVTHLRQRHVTNPPSQAVRPIRVINR